MDGVSLSLIYLIGHNIDLETGLAKFVVQLQSTAKQSQTQSTTFHCVAEFEIDYESLLELKQNLCIAKSGLRVKC